MARVNYFKGVETLEDVRATLIEKLQELDPKSGRWDTMFTQYLRACDTVGAKHKSRKGKIYEGHVAISPGQFAILAQKILGMEGVNLKVEGTWVWIYGNTKANKQQLGELGRQIAGTGKLTYSGKRQAWWFEDKARTA